MNNRETQLDELGRPITQSLFLEMGYTPNAIYTLKDVDYTYKGKLYPSAKRLYMEMEDPTEYEYAITYFLGWDHWQRICANKNVAEHINKWRDELEVKLRSRAVKAQIAAAKAGNYQASKWLADRGWISRGAGRPSKAEVAKELKIAATIENEYTADVVRLKAI